MVSIKKEKELFFYDSSFNQREVRQDIHINNNTLRSYRFFFNKTTLLYIYFIYLLKNNLHMNFVELHKEIAREFKLPLSTTKKIMKSIERNIRDRILFGEEVTLREIGTLTLRVREPKPFLHLKKNKMEMSKKKYFLSLRVTKKMQDELKKKKVY